MSASDRMGSCPRRRTTWLGFLALTATVASSTAFGGESSPQATGAGIASASAPEVKPPAASAAPDSGTPAPPPRTAKRGERGDAGQASPARPSSAPAAESKPVAAVAAVAGEAPAARPAEAHGLATWPLSLQSEVVRLTRSFGGELAFRVLDLADGSAYSYNGETPSYLASVVKIAVMREVYRQIDAGRLSLAEKLAFTADALRDGTGDLKRSAVGASFSIEELVRRMIAQSDNAATDLLLTKVGVDQVNASLERLGGFGPVTTMLEVRRLVYGQLSPRASTLTPGQVFKLAQVRALDERAQLLSAMLGARGFTASELARAYEAYYGALYNSASMVAVTRLLAELHRCEGASPTSCRAMISALEGCETGTARFKAGLPPGAVFAHKTGTQHRRICDVGLLYLGERAFAVAACVKGFAKPSEAEGLLAKLGQATARALLPARPAVQLCEGAPDAGEAPAVESGADGGRCGAGFDAGCVEPAPSAFLPAQQ